MTQVSSIDPREIQCAWHERLLGPLRAEFDQFICQSPMGHHSQTESWARLTCTAAPLSAEYFIARHHGAIVGAAVALRPAALRLALPVAWLERGPVCLSKEWLPPVLLALVRSARERRLVYVHAMPYLDGDDVPFGHAALAAAGFRNNQKIGGTHETTLRMPLCGATSATLFAGPVYTKLRNRFRAAEKAGATAHRGDGRDIRHLEALSREMAAAQHQKTRHPRWFAALGELCAEAPDRYGIFIGRHGSQVINATLVVRRGALATYVMGASVPGSAAYSKAVLPMSLAVQWAASLGCTHFDLGGVPHADDTDEKRLSIALFKRDFSRTPLPLVQCHAAWLLGPAATWLAKWSRAGVQAAPIAPRDNCNT